MAIHKFKPFNIEKFIVSGGGGSNIYLVELITAYLREFEVFTGSVELSSAYNVPLQGREVMSFALLAHDTLMCIPNNLPKVTGAKSSTTLGKISTP